MLKMRINEFNFVELKKIKLFIFVSKSEIPLNKNKNYVRLFVYIKCINNYNEYLNCIIESENN